MAEIWLSKQDAASLLGKQPDFVRTQIIPRLPDDAKQRGRGRGIPWELKGSAVVRAYVEYVAEAATGDPESYVVSDSPALERQREARAKLLEYELAERRRELISVELFRRVTEAAAREKVAVGSVLDALDMYLRENPNRKNQNRVPLCKPRSFYD